MKIIINAIGCVEGGSRLVLRELIQCAPGSILFHVYLPLPKFDPPILTVDNVKLKYISHSLFGRWGRLLFELWLWLCFKVFKADGIINLSNYGLCLSRHHVIYLHNSMLLHETAAQGWSHGRPNVLKRLAFNTCLARGESVYVQTDHMRKRVLAYAAKYKLTPRKVGILCPRPAKVSPLGKQAKTFPFQFFYPTTRFEHKKTGLAIQAITTASIPDADIGLVITLDSNGAAPGRSVHYIGEISYDQVIQYYGISDALLFTSIEESLGLPLLEALDFGLPAVLPNLEYAREIYGGAAVYYELNQPPALVDAIQRLKGDYAFYKAKAGERKSQEWPKRKTWAEHWECFMADIQASYKA